MVLFTDFVDKRLYDFVPITISVIIFLPFSNTADTIKCNMAVDMIGIIMKRIDCLKLFSKVLLYKFPYNLHGNIFINGICRLFKWDNDMVSLASPHLIVPSLSVQHLFQCSLRQTVMAWNIQPIFSFAVLRNIINRICEMLCLKSRFCTSHMQNFTDSHT